MTCKDRISVKLSAARLPAVFLHYVKENPLLFHFFSGFVSDVLFPYDHADTGFWKNSIASIK
jgi:hypothetical protein